MRDRISFLKGYKSKLCQTLETVDFDIVSEIISEFENTVKKNSVIYVIGNGGSSATASHMENDLGIGLKRRNIVDFNIKSLGDNSAVCTAIANDVGYENIFYLQLLNKLKPDDILVAISCSGNSPNIVKAVEYARKIGTKVIGLTGFDGGILKKMSDLNFHVEAETGEYGLVEDIHMMFDHMIYSYYIDKESINV